MPMHVQDESCAARDKRAALPEVSQRHPDGVVMGVVCACAQPIARTAQAMFFAPAAHTARF